MSYEKLKEYMQTLATLEQERYIIQNSLTGIRKGIQENEVNQKTLVEQAKYNTAKIQEPAQVDKKMSLGFLFLIWCCLVWGYSIGIPVSMLFKQGSVEALACKIVCALLLGLVPIIWRSKSLKKKEAQAVLEWEQAKRENEEKLQRQQACYNELYESRPLLVQRESEMKSALKSCEETLNAYYGLNILPQDKKYRGFVPVHTILQYLQTGRTYSLQRNPKAADPGALNMYEEELYHHQVISELQQINQNLKIVQQRQAMLYEAYCEGNRQIAALTKSVNEGFAQLHRDNQIAEFTRTQIAQNTHRMSMLADYAYTASLV